MSEHGDFPAVAITRRLQWQDTDASGHHHHSVVLRWVEEAEAVLLAELELTDLLGHTPRVRYEANYRSRVWFTDPVEIRLAVAGLGRSSATLSFEIHGPAGVVADGEMTIVHTASSSEASVPWPEATQAALAGNGQPAAAAGGGTTSAA